jgi:phage terminase large subunit
MEKKLNVEKLLLRTLGMPTEKQQLFHKASTRYVAYGGAKGGGKSHGVRQKATYLCFKHKGIDILIIRRTLSELEKNHVYPLLKAYTKFPASLKPKYNEQKKTFTFPWGSRITLGYCDTENDVWQYQGQEYQVIFIDEATRLTGIPVPAHQRMRTWHKGLPQAHLPDVQSGRAGAFLGEAAFY